MIERREELQTLHKLLSRYPVVGIIGARQVGKTTLARTYIAKAKGPVTYFDLENPEDEARLADPMLALKDLRGLVVIDEIRRRPDLFPILRVLLDRPGAMLFLGDASRRGARSASHSWSIAHGLEINLTTVPRITSSMCSALSNLKLTRLYVIHSGQHTFSLHKKVPAVAFKRFLEESSHHAKGKSIITKIEHNYR